MSASHTSFSFPIKNPPPPPQQSLPLLKRKTLRKINVQWGRWQAGWTGCTSCPWAGRLDRLHQAGRLDRLHQAGRLDRLHELALSRPVGQAVRAGLEQAGWTGCTKLAVGRPVGQAARAGRGQAGWTGCTKLRPLGSAADLGAAPSTADVNWFCHVSCML